MDTFWGPGTAPKSPAENFPASISQSVVGPCFGRRARDPEETGTPSIVTIPAAGNRGGPGSTVAPHPVVKDTNRVEAASKRQVRTKILLVVMVKETTFRRLRNVVLSLHFSVIHRPDLSTRR